MIRHRHCATSFALTLLLSACAVAPTRDLRPDVASAVAAAVAGAPDLPSRDAEATDDTGAPPTAADAVREALRNNPRVRLALARLGLATAERLQAGLLPNPTGALMALRPDGGGRFELDAGLTEDLYALLTRADRVAAADAGQRRVAAEGVGELVGLARDTEAAYYRLLAQQRREALMRAQADAAQRELDLVHRQARAGSEDAAEALALDAALAMRAHDLGEAQADTARARAALAALLGRPTAAALQLPATWPDLPLAGLDGAALQQLAQTHRPELQATAAAVAEARAERTLATGALRTTQPALSANGMRDRDGTRQAGPGLSLQLPLFDHGQARSAAADARVDAAQQADAAARRSIPLEVETALATLAAAQLALEHADHHLREQQRLAALAEREHAAGVRDLRATVGARQAALTAELQQVRAREARYLAWVDLERAVGTALAPGDG